MPRTRTRSPASGSCPVARPSRAAVRRTACSRSSATAPEGTRFAKAAKMLADKHGDASHADEQLTVFDLIECMLRADGNELDSVARTCRRVSGNGTCDAIEAHRVRRVRAGTFDDSLPRKATTAYLLFAAHLRKRAPADAKPSRPQVNRAWRGTSATIGVGWATSTRLRRRRRTPTPSTSRWPSRTLARSGATTSLRQRRVHSRRSRHGHPPQARPPTPLTKWSRHRRRWAT
mmetsp:Transcript_14575/g.37802  ORF Transcript_14575/g.37802 Transcript_14575/m.37802 type:complete len:232 (+) Transcript_14575:703-1398(+)